MKQFTENHMDNHNQKTGTCYIPIKKEKKAGTRICPEQSVYFNAYDFCQEIFQMEVIWKIERGTYVSTTT